MSISDIKATFYFDDREDRPDRQSSHECIGYVKKIATDDNVPIKIVTCRLKTYDVLLVVRTPTGEWKSGWEIKRTMTDDFRKSLHSNHLKDQVRRMYEQKNPFWLVIVGEITNLVDRKAMSTLSSEIDGIGGRFYEAKNEYFLAHKLVRQAEVASMEKKVVFEPFTQPVLKDDSILVRMLKQFPDMGEDAYNISKSGKNFLQALFYEKTRHEILKIVNKEEVVNMLSATSRAMRNKPQSSKPLKKFVDFVDWFIG
jgi:ERCC4-type nuclease